ncbi:alpha/beta hydrolase [Xanthomonas cassavae CFBP 4642]|uniref:Alpha/beta hydrolase n=1 Tax=Xanthomonas cassavae CFBP 4642 TaxID=1219375 RepID=A0ABS8H8Y4_9XANT|nr:alpha/beta hydrolase [Xanthomonas cassavae CFBP 4642]
MGRDPTRQPYVLLSHGWASYGLRFAAWVPRLRALGYAVLAFDQPALVIHDRHDRETPLEEGARFAALWPGAQLFTTEGLGHNRMLDHASVIARALEFIGPAAA